MKKAFAAERKNDSGPRTALGTLLIEEGVIDSAQLEEALRLGTESGERLGEVLVRMGWASGGRPGAHPGAPVEPPLPRAVGDLVRSERSCQAVP